jgi:hypothetical protein
MQPESIPELPGVRVIGLAGLAIGAIAIALIAVSVLVIRMLRRQPAIDSRLRAIFRRDADRDRTQFLSQDDVPL